MPDELEDDGREATSNKKVLNYFGQTPYWLE